MCLLQMGKDVKDSETEKRWREEFRVERDRRISRMKTVYSVISQWLTQQWGGGVTINRNQTIQ